MLRSMERLIRAITEKITGKKYISPADEEIPAKSSEQRFVPVPKEKYEAKLRNRIDEIAPRFGDVSPEDRGKVFAMLPFEKQTTREYADPSVILRLMSEVVGRPPNSSGAAGPVENMIPAETEKPSKAA